VLAVPKPPMPLLRLDDPCSESYGTTASLVVITPRSVSGI
jgi:hypothetical protein